MATRTYHCGALGRVHRLTNLIAPWVDVSVYNTYVGYVGNLYDIKTDPNDADKMFVVGEADSSSGFSGIGVSSNAGSSWIAPGGNFIGVKQWNEVWPIDSANIVAVGGNGAVAISNNGGLTFNLVTYATPSGGPTTGQSFATHFLTALLGLASFEGYVLKTINGGVTWSILNSGMALNIAGAPVTVTAVYMSHNQQTIVVQTNKAIFTSTNGGLTFVIVHTWTFREGLHMTWLPRYNASQFWATGQGDARVTTTTPAGTWTVQQASSSTLIPKDFAAHYYNFNNGFFSQNANLLVSSNSGSTGTITDSTSTGVIFAVWTTANPCYMLVDCLGQQAPVITSTDLGINVGKIVKIDGSDTCWEIQNSDTCTGAIPVTITGPTLYTECSDCLPKCYILTDCKGEKDPITVSNDLSAYIGKIIQIQGDNTCWTVAQTFNCTCSQVVTVMRQYTNCTKCPPPLVPEITELFIEPGYETPNCNPEEVIEANVEFGDAIYKKVVKKRFGVTICCDYDEEGIILQKELTDLNLLYDPKLCPVVPAPCLPPCNVTAYISLFTGGGCPAPLNVIATLTV